MVENDPPNSIEKRKYTVDKEGVIKRTL